MAKIRKKIVTKAKKKNWYSIIAPRVFNEQVLGEISLSELSLAKGRKVTINLMTLTGDMRKQSSEVNFVIDEIKGDKAYASVIGLKVLPSSVKRMVRRGKNKLNYRYNCKTKDGKNIILKSIMITAGMAHKPVLSALRKKSDEVICSAISKMDFESFVRECVVDKFQKGVKAQLKKIYPVRIFEIIGVEIAKDKRHVEKEKKDIKKENVEEKEEVEENAEGGKEAKEAAEKKEEKVEEKKEDKPKEEGKVEKEVKEEKKE